MNIFRTKDERILCAPVIDGIEKVQPRVGDAPSNGNGCGRAEDMAEYKTCLAAKLFADVLGQTQGERKGQPEQTQQPEQAQQPEQVKPVRTGRWQTGRISVPDETIRATKGQASRCLVAVPVG